MKFNYFYYSKQANLRMGTEEKLESLSLKKENTKDLINMQFTKYQQCRYLNFAEMVENLIAISWTCSYFEYFLWYLSLYFFCINVVKIGIFFFVCYLINIHGKKTFLYWKLSFFELVVHCNPKSAHMCMYICVAHNH